VLYPPQRMFAEGAEEQQQGEKGGKKLWPRACNTHSSLEVATH